MAACAHTPAACSTQASSKVARSRPASPGTKRRAGITIQLVVASRNSPIGLRNGTRSHWKWKRASSMNTKKLTTTSTRNTPFCVNTSVLSEFFAELGAARRRGLDGAPEALGELLLVEHVQRRLGGAALRGHVPAQRRGRFAARSRELRRAQ